MTAECTAEALQFQAVGPRAVQTRFDGGRLTSDGGAVFPREVDRATGTRAQFAAGVRAARDARLMRSPPIHAPSMKRSAHDSRATAR